MGRLSQSPSPWGKAWNRPSLFSFSQSAEGLNQKAALLWAPVASALCVPSPGPEETLAEPGFLTPGREAVFPSGCQPPAKRRLLPPPLPAAPPTPKSPASGGDPWSLWVPEEFPPRPVFLLRLVHLHLQIEGKSVKNAQSPRRPCGVPGASTPLSYSFLSQPCRVGRIVFCQFCR